MSPRILLRYLRIPITRCQHVSSHGPIPGMYVVPCNLYFVVREPRAQHDGHGPEVEHVEGRGAHHLLPLLRGEVVVPIGRIDDGRRPDDAPGQEARPDHDAEEEEAPDEALPDAAGGDVHDPPSPRARRR